MNKRNVRGRGERVEEEGCNVVGGKVVLAVVCGVLMEMR